MQKPHLASARLKAGFYIEVCDRGSRSGIMICSINKKEMLYTADTYKKNKDVIIYGEFAEGKWLSEKIFPPKAVPKQST